VRFFFAILDSQHEFRSPQPRPKWVICVRKKALNQMNDPRLLIKMVGAPRWLVKKLRCVLVNSYCVRKIVRDESQTTDPTDRILRKEVIQPQVPLRLPCYDLVPITELTLGACFPKVSSATSCPPRFRGLTGGVYKAQEHIHRSIADLRLLAIPASCRRVAACNPN
jgi:hypothetical protein